MKQQAIDCTKRKVITEDLFISENAKFTQFRLVLKK